MARPPKRARITGVRELIPGVVELRCRAEEPLDYVGGNYIIARTTLPAPERPGEVIKRAWSMGTLLDPADPHAFTLRVEVVGAASRWLAAREEGDELLFSGPWGKKFRFFEGDTGPVHFVATGTGISPAGVLAGEWQRDQETAGAALWWKTSRPYVTAEIEALRADPDFAVCIGSSVLQRVPIDPAALYFLAGDGALLAPLADRLIAAGAPAERVRTEYFFNKPTAASGAAS